MPCMPREDACNFQEAIGSVPCIGTLLASHNYQGIFILIIMPLHTLSVWQMFFFSTLPYILSFALYTCMSYQVFSGGT